MFENVPTKPGQPAVPKESKDWGPWKPVDKPDYNPPDTKDEISSVLSKYSSAPPPEDSDGVTGGGRKIILVFAALLVIFGVGIGVWLTVKGVRRSATNANANTAANANVVTSRSNASNQNSTKNSISLCAAAHFRCSQIAASPNQADPESIDVNLLGSTDPSITIDLSNVIIMNVSGREVAQCISGAEVSPPGGKYVGCTLKKTDYSVGSNAEILLSLSSGVEKIQLTLPGISANVNGNSNAAVNISTNMNKSIKCLTNITTSVAEDPDRDGLTDEQEKFYKTDPNNPDTDGDGYCDGLEVQNGYNPRGPGRLTNANTNQ